MRSSRTITLFSERPEPAQRSSSFLVSVLAHAAAISVLSYGIIHAPVTKDPEPTRNYTVRHLDLHTPDPKPQASNKGEVLYPGPHVEQKKTAEGGNPVPHRAALRLTADAEPGPQTLVQPDISHPAHLKEETPIPTVVIWAPKKQVVKNVVAPLPEPATASDVKPSVQAPNEEVNLTDLSVAASDTPSRLQFIPSSTTSPLMVHGPEKAQLPPVTASQTSATPTPAAVMSLSDLKMKNGPVTLPPVNETALKKEEGPLTEGQVEKPSVPGQGNPEGTAGGAGSGTGAPSATAATTKVAEAKDSSASPAQRPAASTTTVAEARDSPASPVQRPAVSTTTVSQATVSPASPVQRPAASTDARTYPPPGSPEAKDESYPPTSHFVLPKDGQFGAVVVGATMKEEYPEVPGMWGGRLAYTVYLHVGLEKSWILQYSIPRAVDAEAGGNAPRLEAPWPYDIVRPNLAAGAINADALMVHGFVNEAGHFESLAVAFPPEFLQAQYVLGALSQWQFRPAAQNGRPAKVEVVLIIPEVDE